VSNIIISFLLFFFREKKRGILFVFFFLFLFSFSFRDEEEKKKREEKNEEDPTMHFAVLSKGNRVKIPEPGRKDTIEATQTNSEKSAEAPGRVLFSF